MDPQVLGREPGAEERARNRARVSEPDFPPSNTTILYPLKSGHVFWATLCEQAPLPSTLTDHSTMVRAIRPASEFACGCGAVAPRSNGLTNQSPTASDVLPAYTG